MTSYDPESVSFFDIAHEGAQARVVAAAVPELARVLGGLRPRSIVILAADQVSRAAAHVAVGLAEPAEVPMMVSESLPRFTGALDVVVVAGDSPWAERALHAAARRGATTILLNEIEDAPEDTVVIDTLPTAEGISPVRAITAVHAVSAVLSEDPVLVSADWRTLPMPWTASWKHYPRSAIPRRTPGARCVNLSKAAESFTAVDPIPMCSRRSARGCTSTLSLPAWRARCGQSMG